MSLLRSLVIFAILFFAMASLLFANGGAWQVGVPATGNGAASDKKRSTEVSIEEENLTIDLHQEFAVVEVRYRMKNNGAKVAQDFFFPVERWSPDDSGEGSATPADLEDYKIAADGAELKWKNIDSGEKAPVVQDENWGDFPPAKKSWKKSEIPFAANQAREVVIHYRAEYSGNDSSVSDDGHRSDHVLIYSLSPAATWKGPIGRGKITINVLHPRPEEVAVEKPNERFKKIGETRYEWSFEKLKPTLDDDLKIVAHHGFDTYPTGYYEDEAQRQIPREYVIEGERYYLLHGDFEATASSTLKPISNHNYDVANIKSLEPDLTWAEGVEGDGIGESIQLKSNRPLPLDEIQIMPGYVSSENKSLWSKNNRVAELEITLNDEHTFTAKIPDEKFSEPYPIPVRGYDKPVTTVKLIIKAVHRGTSAHDTCISSVRLKGKLLEKPEFQPAR